MEFERQEAALSWAMRKRHTSVISVLAMPPFLLLMGSCEQREPASSFDAAAAAPYASAPPKSSKLRYSLGIIGYNYTEVGIYDYSVNGTSAFNLGVSTEKTGGGKTVCCFSWVPTAKLPTPVQVQWTRDGETWCRKTVAFSGPAAVEPTTLEVHFFPDRHIEVAVTDTYSPPRLRLSGAGADYRVGDDVRSEKTEAIRRDKEAAECRSGEFPIGTALNAGSKK